MAWFEVRSLFKIRTGEDGVVSAEFAVALPAMLTTVLFAMSAIAVASMQLQAQQLAGLAVRSLSQSESEVAVQRLVRKIDASGVLSVRLADGVLCADVVKRPSGVLSLIGYRPKAMACTWVGKYFEP